MGLNKKTVSAKIDDALMSPEKAAPAGRLPARLPARESVDDAAQFNTNYLKRAQRQLPTLEDIEESDSDTEYNINPIFLSFEKDGANEPKAQLKPEAKESSDLNSSIDSDESSTEYCKIPGNFSLFGEDDEEAYEEEDVAPTSPTRPVKRGPIQLTPDRPSSALKATPNRNGQSPPKDHRQGPLIAKGGCGEIFDVCTSEGKATPFVEKRIPYKDAERQEFDLLKKLEKSGPLKETANGLIYKKHWGNLNEFCLDFWLKDNTSWDIKIKQAVILHIFSQILTNLDEFHTKTSQCHNDIKPANILLENETNTGLVLCDFGSMNSQKRHDTPITLQFADPCHFDPNADLELNYQNDYYSVALTMIKIITGKSAYQLFNEEYQLDFNSYDDQKKLAEQLTNPELLQECFIPLITKEYTAIFNILSQMLPSKSEKRITHSAIIKAINEAANELKVEHEHIANAFMEIKHLSKLKKAESPGNSKT
ncbi:MAG: protein kinase domain-containing protein [Candidatus Marinamargulisbacteria bacterium]